jgi:glycosyltransferase involved in cell wall biosynthesis/SAM-dependent methyltransferase
VKVMHVVHFPVFGGPHNQALRLAAPLAARGFTTLVVLPDEPGGAAERLREGGMDVRALPLHRLRATVDPRSHIGFLASLPAEVRRLRALIRTEGIDMVQIGGLVNPHGAIAARLEHVPVVWQLLDTRAPRPVAVVAMAWVRALADVVMSTGLAVARAHPGYSAIANRIVTFFPPVDLDRFVPRPQDRSRVRAAWGIRDAAPVIGCVANINPQKGIVELVDAFAQVRSRHPEARLVLVGAEYGTHESYSAAVRSRLAKHELTEGRDVIFVGDRKDVEHQLAAMDVFALAAEPHSEGITTAVLEGMAVGLPAVVTDVGGLREAIAHGRTGFLIAPGRTDSLAEALIRLLDEPELRARMGDEARQVAQAQFGAEASADAHVRAYAMALGRHRKRIPGPVAGPQGPMPTSTGRVVDGIDVFLRAPELAGQDELDHAHRDLRKDAQARHFDRPREEQFEIDRPHSTPGLYRFLLAEKFRRSVSPIRSRLPGASALTVCGGSGMDAEFLSRAGASVTTSDLSLGAAIRAKSRAARFGLSIRSIVSEVEHLPYADRSVDLVAVHDGLHHLEDPYAGLAEMARVARRWVVVTEPARASITRLAIRLGLALEKEEAGNQVARMEPSEVASFLEARGFTIVRSERYAMYYPHHPGRVFRILSQPVVFPVVRLGWRLGNALFGRFGNKMVVLAERDHSIATDSRSSSTPSPIRTTE